MTDPKAEIRAVVEERVAAVRTKDRRAVGRRIAAEVVIFDVLPPLNAHRLRAENDVYPEQSTDSRLRVAWRNQRRRTSWLGASDPAPD